MRTWSRFVNLFSRMRNPAFDMATGRVFGVLQDLLWVGLFSNEPIGCHAHAQHEHVPSALLAQQFHMLMLRVSMAPMTHVFQNTSVFVTQANPDGPFLTRLYSSWYRAVSPMKGRRYGR